MAGKNAQRRMGFRLVALGLATIVGFLSGMVAAGGVRTGAELLGDARFDNCAGASCTKAEFRANYKYLDCVYGRWFGPDLRIGYLVQEWEGDLDIPAAMTESGKPFPPPLPPLRRLSEEDIAHVNAGDVKSACPLLFPGGDEPVRDEAGLPVIDEGSGEPG